MKTSISLLALLLFASLAFGQPQNDNCSYVPQVHAIPFSAAGNTTLATNDFTQCGGFEGSRDVIYMLWLDCPARVQISLCGSEFDTYLEVRSATGGCPGSTLLACNDDACGTQSIVEVDAAAGVAYYVIVQGFDPSDYGNYTISFTDVSTPPENDTCPGIAFSELPFSHTGTTVGATQQTLHQAQTCPATDYAGIHDVIYTYTPTSCYNATASVCGSGYNTVISVRSDGNCPGNTLVACSDDFCGTQSETSWTAVAGTTYYIIVAGFGYGAIQYCGNHTLNVTGTPAACDACPGTVISSLPYTHSGTTAGMSNQYDLACRGGSAADVVYRLAPLPNCQTVTASLCGSGYDTQLFVRTGGACPGTTQLDCNDDFCGSPVRQSQVSFFANVGQEYWIIVGGYRGAVGNYVLNVTGAVAYQTNDECGGARAITALPYTDSGNTICGTDDYNPECTPWDGSPDVFYQLALPCATVVTASLCGSGYDTILELRRDGACPGSTHVACNDDYCGSPVRQSQLTFSAEAGVIYYPIVDGFANQALGAYTLNVTGATVPPQEVVIEPAGSDVLLHWPPVCGATQYDIYRSTMPSVPIIPANHIGLSLNTTYTDPNILNQAAFRHYYAVVATFPNAATAAAEVPAVEVLLDLKAGAK